MEVDDEANCSTDPDGSVYKASVTKKSMITKVDQSNSGLKQMDGIAAKC